MLTLHQLAKQLRDSMLVGPAEVELLGLTDDSRTVEPGYLFVAVRGRKTDGHRYVASAIEKGASAVILERAMDECNGTPALLVGDSRAALATAAAAFHGWPGYKLRAVAVTGTNGKTTAAYMMKSVLEAAEHSVGLLGTIEYSLGSRTIAADMTTPGPLEMQPFLSEIVKAGNDFCVLEASSHSLDQHRIDHIALAAGIFTNITSNEHLDYHGTFDHYLRSKLRLFEHLPADACAAINVDDPHADRFINASRCNVMRYGLGENADVRGHAVKGNLDGTQFEVITPAGSQQIRGCFVGEHNVRNALGVIAAAVGMGIDLEAIRKGLEQFECVPGRLERIDCGQDFNLFVDYAHTDDALKSVLMSLRRLVTGRLCAVFGCGGDRDRSKRARMGTVAQHLAHHSILTADNSRSESTEDIIAEICKGFTDHTCYEICPDRRMAIRHAIERARPGDTVLIAGKGHETTQEIDGHVSNFDDRTVARCWLRRRIEGETMNDIDRASITT